MSALGFDFAGLARGVEGDVSARESDRRLVAQDASPYRVLPAGVVRPRSADDCAAAVEWAGDQGVPLIPRGGGTGLCGQCVGRGVVVDTSRYMDGIGDFDPDTDTVRVQPGATCAALNRALAPHGRMFGPDPSTATRATLGGMLGTNAWGPHAPVDGTTREQIVCVEAVLADGRPVVVGPVDVARAEPGPGGDAARRRALLDILERRRDAVEHVFPAPGSGLCSNNGYPLYRLLQGQPFVPEGEAFNEAILFAGAEGTLGLVTAITLRTRPLRRERRLLCPHFPDVATALAAVAEARAAGAAAVELLDAHLLDLTRRHPGQRANRFWLEGTPGAVLIIEFADGTEPGGLAARLRADGATAVPEIEGEDVERVWALRRASLGLLMGQVSARNAVGGMEDTAVAVDELPAYIGEVDRLLAAEGVDAVRYGSVSLGLVHLRPLLDLGDGDDRERYRRLLDGLAGIVAGHGGVWSTKHGDGRLRAPWLGRVLGAEAMAAMRAVKQAYDPGDRFNPGKIVDAPDPLTDLRATAAAAAPAVTGFDWAPERGLVAAAARCQGAGACRQATADGGMCPTYQATREDRHATRGRANLLQQALAAPDPRAALADDDLHAALALCLGCKACQHECPARVDMARLKAEALYQRHRVRRMPVAARAIAAFGGLSALGARVPRLANALLASPLTRLAGIDARPPPLATRSLPARLRGRRPGGGDRGDLVLAVDVHTAYYEPAIGEAAIAVLERIGFRVHVSAPVSLGRPAISQGALDRARREIGHAVRVLTAAGPGDAPVIGLEPSEILTLRDEAPALVAARQRGEVEAMAGRALTLEEFLAGPGADAVRAAGPRSAGPLALHDHCHAKAAGAAGAGIAALGLLPDTAVADLRAGCCGMAGAFGYRHPEVSRAVAELALAPAVRALDGDTTVVAAGTSCRQQIARVTGRRALHPVEVFVGVV